MTNVDLVTTQWDGLKNISAESIKIGLNGQTGASLSCDSNGHGQLVLDGISFDAASLSATYTANTLLEGLV